MSKVKEEFEYNLNNLCLQNEKEFNETISENSNNEKLSKNNLFMFQILQLLNSNLILTQESIKGNCDLYEKKCDSLKNFMLNSIPNSILNLKLSDLIIMLENTKNLSNEEIRKSLSSENNLIHCVKISYDMNKICSKIINSNKKNNIDNSIQKIKHFNSQIINNKSFNPKLIYASPSPIINHKYKSKINSHSQKKNKFQTPEKSIWKI